MDADRLSYFKDKLLQKRASLSIIVHKTEDQSREKDQNAQDVVDMAVESYTKDFLLGKSAGDRQILQQIQNALDRIDDDTYGVCSNCEDEINPKRLDAVPWAEMCVKCQGLLEKGLLER
ncbi:MAG: TraR/DksA family transcriptional regulator [Acidobacteriota bacterium]|jgi:DnaK suppressor protein|nr:TraR/DksA family transcriptional regulator [Acidobacteriota bacterium]